MIQMVKTGRGNRVFSFETLDRCAVIKIKDLLPRKIKTSEINSSLKDGFLFLAKSGDRYLVHENLGFEFTSVEAEHLKKFISTWRGGEDVTIENGVVEIEIPSFLVPFIDGVNAIPGCRVSPNLLRVGGDVCMYLEFHETSRARLSSLLMEFLASEHLFEKELVYIGRQEGRIPYILKMYLDLGNSLGDLFVISTIWEFRNGEEQNQNQGVFLNSGNYVPKSFVDGTSDRLIFMVENSEIQGDAPYETVDSTNGVFEFEVRSRFFSDFYREVIRSYSGPIFCHMTVSGKYHTTYYVVEKSKQARFLAGLNNNWKRKARENHVNYLGIATDLESFLK